MENKIYNQKNDKITYPHDLGVYPPKFPYLCSKNSKSEENKLKILKLNILKPHHSSFFAIAFTKHVITVSKFLIDCKI